MRRLARVLAAVALTGAALLVRPPAASACTCGARPPGSPQPPRPGAIVEGSAIELVEGSEEQPGSDLGGRPSSWSSSWRFAVERVERGAIAPGDEVVVQITRGSGAGCGVDVGPVDAGRRYRVGGAFDEERGLLYLGLCSDPFLDPLDAGAPDTGDADTGTGSHGPSSQPRDVTDLTAVARTGEPSGGGGVDAGLVGVAAGAAVGVAAGLAAVRRRSRGVPGP